MSRLVERLLLAAIALVLGAMAAFIIFWTIRNMADQFSIPKPTAWPGYLIRQSNHQITGCSRVPLIVPYANDPTRFEIAMDSTAGIDPLYRRDLFCVEFGNIVGVPRKPFWALPIILGVTPTGAPFLLRGAPQRNSP